MPEQPPALRQLDREVAAPLLGRQPPIQPPWQKNRRNAVRPSYQSWLPGSGEQGRRVVRRAAARRCTAPSSSPRTRGPTPSGRPRRRPSPARCRGRRHGLLAVLAGHVQLGLGQQVGHRVRRVEAVADVADVVEPGVVRASSGRGTARSGRWPAPRACRRTCRTPTTARRTSRSGPACAGRTSRRRLVPRERQLGQAGRPASHAGSGAGRSSRAPRQRRSVDLPQLTEEQPAELLHRVRRSACPSVRNVVSCRRKSGRWIVMTPAATTRAVLRCGRRHVPGVAA